MGPNERGTKCIWGQMIVHVAPLQPYIRSRHKLSHFGVHSHSVRFWSFWGLLTPGMGPPPPLRDNDFSHGSKERFCFIQFRVFGFSLTPQGQGGAPICATTTTFLSKNLSSDRGCNHVITFCFIPFPPPSPLFTSYL